MAVYKDTKTSILAYLKNFITRNSLTNIQVFDFDSHASIHKLPEVTLIGQAGLTISNIGEQYVVNCVLGVCTLSTDTNLLILTDIIDKLFDELKPGFMNEDLVIKNTSGNILGHLKVSGDVSVQPVDSEDNRPLQGINVEFVLGYDSLPVL